jgi:hypothetical protein
MNSLRGSLEAAQQWLESSPARSLLLRWVLANVAGWSLGLYLGSLALSWVGGIVGLLLAGAVAGLLAGTAQTLALRGQWTISLRRWALLSTAGGALAALPVFLALPALIVGRGTALTIMGALFGLIFGLVQTSALRGGQDRVLLWALANLFGGGLCALLSPGGIITGIPVCCTPGPVLFGLVTGGVLLTWLRASR